MTDYEDKSYEELKTAYEANNTDVELLWRLAESCYRKANALDAKLTEKKKAAILEGREYGRKAVEAVPDNNLQVLKWAAILTGSSTEYLGTKEKIEQAYVLKGLLDKAIAIDPKDSTLLHLRGRYAFGIANLSWLERKAASAFFATPPEATIDEALADFIACHSLRTDFIENNLYIARCYISKKDYPSAVQILNEALTLTASDENEKTLLEEAAQLIKKYGK